MFIKETKIRVRYGETDQMGYVYYGNYPLYYEVGRVEALREIGIVYKDMEREYNVMMPVMSMEVKYLRPAKYDDLLTIRTSLKEMPVRDIIFHFEIFNEESKLLNAGHVKLCFVDITTNQRVDLPLELGKKLHPYFEREN